MVGFDPALNFGRATNISLTLTGFFLQSRVGAAEINDDTQ